MTTLENRPGTALLVVDVQVGVVAEAHERDAVVARIAALAGGPGPGRAGPGRLGPASDEELVHGSEDWHLVPELSPAEGEAIVEKEYGDAFEDTALESVLAGLGVGRLVVAGAETDACIRSDAARRVHARLRRDPGQRRAHHRGQVRVGCAATGPGDRAHQPLLDVPVGPRPHGRHG